MHRVIHGGIITRHISGTAVIAAAPAVDVVETAAADGVTELPLSPTGAFVTWLLPASPAAIPNAVVVLPPPPSSIAAVDTLAVASPVIAQASTAPLA